MFKTLGIILRIQRIRDQQIRITLFTREFGKITGWAKQRNFFWDIGDIIETRLERRGQENIIKSIENEERINTDGWNYAYIIQFLRIIHGFDILLPQASQYVQIFDDYNTLTQKLKNGKDNLHIDHFHLFQLRILKQLGYIDASLFQRNQRLQYIHDHIGINSVRNILNAKELMAIEREIIQTTNEKIIHQLTNS